MGFDPELRVKQTAEVALLAEDACCAAVLLAPVDEQAEVYERVNAIAPFSCFFSTTYRDWWVAIGDLVQRGEDVTVLTVGGELARNGLLDVNGGPMALVETLGHWYTHVGVEAHARLVKQEHDKRQALGRASELAAAAGRGDLDTANKLMTGQSNDYDLPSRASGPYWRS